MVVDGCENHRHYWVDLGKHPHMDERNWHHHLPLENSQHCVRPNQTPPHLWGEEFMSTNKNRPKCNHSIYDYIQVLVACN